MPKVSAGLNALVKVSTKSGQKRTSRIDFYRNVAGYIIGQVVGSKIYERSEEGAAG